MHPAGKYLMERGILADYREDCSLALVLSMMQLLLVQDVELSVVAVMWLARGWSNRGCGVCYVDSEERRNLQGSGGG